MILILLETRATTIEPTTHESSLQIRTLGGNKIELLSRPASAPVKFVCFFLKKNFLKKIKKNE
jgi:hypothetical protein